MHFLRADTGYRMKDHKHEKMGITDINAIIKTDKKCLEHTERMPENQIPKLSQYKQRGK